MGHAFGILLVTLLGEAELMGCVCGKRIAGREILLWILRRHLTMLTMFHTRSVGCAHGEHVLHAARANSFRLHSARGNSGVMLIRTSVRKNSCGGARGGNKGFEYEYSAWGSGVLL